MRLDRPGEVSRSTASPTPPKTRSPHTHAPSPADRVGTTTAAASAVVPTAGPVTPGTVRSHGGSSGAGPPAAAAALAASVICVNNAIGSGRGRAPCRRLCRRCGCLRRRCGSRPPPPSHRPPRAWTRGLDERRRPQRSCLPLNTFQPQPFTQLDLIRRHDRARRTIAPAPRPQWPPGASFDCPPGRPSGNITPAAVCPPPPSNNASASCLLCLRRIERRLCLSHLLPLLLIL